MPAKCPTCGKLSVEPYTPFCTERCASIDLGNWFSGKYSVPADDVPDEDELDAMIDAVESGEANIDGEGGERDMPQGAEIMPFQRK
ncbi:MAG: DNA gyrase inhibitor YacG [Candidatus Puniceispirillales bacterium]